MVDNNAIRIKRELITKISQLAFEGRLVEEIDKVPIEKFPKGGISTRCCVYKSRAITKYRIMALLGFRVEDEEDELKALSEYAKEGLDRQNVSPHVLTVIDEACSACVRVNYFVTNACKGCLARPCVINCPKGAIEIRDGQAHINPDKCVNCGLCMKVCPYHAIIYVPVPCEDICPVGAISKDETGKEHIDYEKCIYCGKCMVVCPFSAIVECSQLIDVIKHLKSDRKVIALFAPALVGQFQSPMEKIAGAIIELGFDDVYEVALGAEVTAHNEAIEFKEKILEGENRFMTSSCCPAYVEMVKKHIPELKSFVSTTRSPMHYTAQMLRENFPNAILVFISPCVAKRNEALNDEYVDYVLSFEELGCMFIAKGIDVDSAEEYVPKQRAYKSGRGFPVIGGVSEALKYYLSDDDKQKLSPMTIDGINKKSINLLKSMVNRPLPNVNFVEAMACEGGCVGGPTVISLPKIASSKIKRWIESNNK